MRYNFYGGIDAKTKFTLTLSHPRLNSQNNQDFNERFKRVYPWKIKVWQWRCLNQTNLQGVPPSVIPHFGSFQINSGSELKRLCRPTHCEARVDPDSTPVAWNCHQCQREYLLCLLLTCFLLLRLQPQGFGSSSCINHSITHIIVPAVAFEIATGSLQQAL